MSNDPNSTESPSAETQNTEHMIPKSRFDDVNTKYKDTLARLEALEAQSRERETQAEETRQKELAEQNRYKELYEEAQKQLEALKLVQSDAKRYRESFQTSLQTRLDSIPEERKHLVPEFDDPIKLSAWLDKALPDLSGPVKPQAPKLDGGSGGTTSPRMGTSLTQDEIAFATAAGIPLDAYAASKSMRGQPINLDKRKEDNG